MKEREAHPRPDRFRPDWWSLDGIWEFGFDESFGREVRVPFPHQAPASGIGERGFHPVVWYRKRVQIPERDGGRLLLHFGAVDQSCTVWIDGAEIGGNQGGYVPFVFDVTGWAGREVSLVLRAVDRTSEDRPRGKQMAEASENDPFRGIRYTASSGIWQSVWLEQVGATYVADFHVRAAADGTLSIEVQSAGEPDPLALQAELILDGREPLRLSSSDGVRIGARIEDVVTWSPDRPALYDLTLALVENEQVVDRVHTRIGFRTIETSGGRILLNGEPIVWRMVLDQGYWPEGLTTPPGDDAIRSDLAWLKAAGFNGVRKHQKLEDPRFWRWADELGLLVWQDMPAAGFGTALPDADHAHLLHEWERGVRRDRNHPSAVCFSPFNESWTLRGVRHDAALQARVREAAARTRALAPDALVVDNSGWQHVDTDLLDLHTYEADPDRLGQRLEAGRDADWAIEWKLEFEAKGKLEAFAGPDGWIRLDFTPLCDGFAYRGQPLVLSEFGGIGCVLEGDRAHSDRFVYAESGTSDELAHALENLIGAVEAFGLAGWCWTQLSDIEQEENGLLTYDRRPKIPAERIAKILAAAASRRPG